MKSRVWLLLLLVVLVPVLPWALIGPQMESWITELVRHTPATSAERAAAGASGVGLLAVDSFLPVPSTLVMSALGLALGAGLGGALASLGVFLSGLIAYSACRWLGAGAARRIAGDRGMERVRGSMNRLGPLVLAMTRSVPVVQEATACLAGLAQMPFIRVLPPLALGSTVTGFAYAAIGASALHNPTLAVVLSLGVPALSWPLIWLALRRSQTSPARGANR